MRVLVAMSGGVDSSVAAVLLAEEGHDVVGATMKLWGGASDSGCCSVADVSDARRAADRIGIDHHVFNFTDEFDEHVVEPYVAAHSGGETPNPCVECNRHLKFGAFLSRARRLGFDAVATGHHARVGTNTAAPMLLRGRDIAKDQSYVLAVLSADELSQLLLPIGELTKDDVRELARSHQLSVADKPDSQDVCFIASHTPGEGRRSFLAERIDLHEGLAVDREGATLGVVEEIELVTVGQRKGLGIGGSGEPRYVLDVDVEARKVTLGSRTELLSQAVTLRDRTWVGEPLVAGTEVLVQTSAHGKARPARVTDIGICFDQPQRRVARGQLVALYLDDAVAGSGLAC